MGARLASLDDVWLFHITDGAPRDMKDAAAYGFATLEAYAEARRCELLSALAVAGVPAERATALGVADQRASYEMESLAGRLAGRLAGATPRLREYPLYHCRDGGMVSGEFLPCADGAPETVTLTPGESALKQRMLACFVTQRETLRPFGCAIERFRDAPAYDFTQPPQASCIYYDLFPWGIGSVEWRKRAGAALAGLDLGGAI